MIDANQIADALKAPRPTPQQRAIVEAPLTPALVVAGAGSGKTETMANRVLWLLANGYVEAGEVLGLTFTRKAAGELGSRIRERIVQLEDATLMPSTYDPFDPPAVATYNSFANTIYRDNAILLGRESDGAVLGEASAWQLARTIVVHSTDDRLAELDKSVDTITKAVLSLSHALSENVVDAVAVQSMSRSFSGVAELPLGGRAEYANEMEQLLGSVGSLPVLLDLAEQFATAKKLRGFVEYSDQVSLALEIVQRNPEIGKELRQQRRVVLLDEYQDTSVVQTWLLAELFSRHPVMAVGDPNQSIYGWRGASAANLDEFSAQFAGGTAAQFALTTSWRNGHDILTLANAIVAPLAEHTRVPVERLQAGPRASNRLVETSFTETLNDEAERVALWLKTEIEAAKGKDKPSAALLFRARKTQPHFIAALQRHGVPYHVLGIGGLLAEPEIADLVSALTVVDNPAAGPELVRLLAGSRWRLGVRDLKALASAASWLSGRDYAQKPLDKVVRDTLRASVVQEEGGSIVDALDFVATAPSGHHVLTEFSETGLARLKDAGAFFARLRGRMGLDLVDFVTLVEQEFLLDIEVEANETRTLGRATMEAFFDALTGYLSVSETAGLGGFLAWLREAEWRDGLSPRSEEPEPGTVQLLTIHGSKGLEWDLVVVPRWVSDELPSKPNEGSTGWLKFGALPYEFRGDAAELPIFDWHTHTTRKELIGEHKSFKEAVKMHHEREERRLAYVAVTRARHALLLTGSFWATQTKPRTPSSFLTVLAADGIIKKLPESSEFEQNPLGEESDPMVWPLDPLGSRRAAVEKAAAVVRDAIPDDAGRWEDELSMLLEERRRKREGAGSIDLPTRVPASRFKDFVSEPETVASHLRRPMPERPYRATRLGTLFHSWVEQRYGIGGLTEEIDAFTLEQDAESSVVEEEEFARLRSIFESSPWASRKPVDVEREIHLPFDGHIIICKIDAVYREGDRYQVVDWKTGKAPKDAVDLEKKQLQLALYRLAYSQWANIAPENIDALFYFVSDNRIITPKHIDNESELIERWRAAFETSE